jgi:hypothetical protein
MIVALVVLLLTAQTPLGRPIDVQPALQSALAWYYRWIEPLPSGIFSIECETALFEEQSFAYCGTVGLSMNIVTNGVEPPRATYVGQEHGSFDAALTAFRTNVNRSRRPLAPIRRVLVSTETLKVCKIDWKDTVRAPVILRKEVRAGLTGEGQYLRYPVICVGDPFYLLYFMRGKELLWIWVFERDADRLKLTWSFDVETQQRKPPSLAVDNLKRGDLWYKIEGDEK